MASPLTEAHVDAQARLRALTGRAAAGLWRNLPGYDRENVADWLARVVPVVVASQRASVGLTDSYIARILRRRPLGIDPDGVIAAARNGTPPETVYERPFVTFWTALKAGSPDAFDAALARVVSTAEMDVQLAMRGTSQAVQRADGGIFGYRRVANAGACRFCVSLHDAYVKDAAAAAMHPRCGCGLEPLTAPHPRAAKLPSGVAVRQHGELGPVVMDPDHSFTDL